MIRVRPPLGNRVLICACSIVMASLGAMGTFGQGPEFDGWGNRLFYALVMTVSLRTALRMWTVALWVEGDFLVSRSIMRTRRILLSEIRDVHAERSDWLLYWIISVTTGEKAYHFEDVRDYPWRAGGGRMERAAAHLRERAVAAGAVLDPQDPVSGQAPQL